MSDFRFVESAGLRATEVAAALRALESYVPAVACTDILQEPFTNLSAWTIMAGTPSVQTGRTGTALRCVGATDRVAYPFAANDYVTVGFAWRTNTTSANVRFVAELFSDANTVRHVNLRYNGTTAQSLSVFRDSTLLGTSATGLIPINTYAYIEMQTFLHDTLGAVTVRVNGTPVVALTNVDTKNAGTTGFDAVQLDTNLSGVTSLWDDLYISVGSGCPFQGDHTIP